MDRTNITDTGYTYGGQNFTKQSRVDGMGNSYTVDVPTSAIPVTSITTPQTPITVTQPNYNVAGYQADGNKASSYLQSSADTAQSNLDQINKSGTDGSAELSNLQRMLGGKSQDLATQYNTKDENGNSVNSLAGQLRKYNAQSQALNYDNLAKTLAEENKATGQNITSTAVSRNTADATRENTINIAKLAMQSAITQADYTTAKEYADTIVNAKYDKITAEIEAEKTNLAQLDKYQLTPAQDKAKAAREALLKKEEEDNKMKQEQETSINAIKMEIAKNGGDMNLVKDAKTVGEAIQLGASALRTPNTEIVKLGDSAAYLIDKNTGKIIKSFGAGNGTASGSSGVSGGNSTTSPFAGVVDTILASGKFTKDQSAQIRNAINNGEDPVAVIKNNAKDIMGQTKGTQVTNYEIAKSSMIDLNNALNDFYAKGGKTTFLSGSYEKVINKLGDVKDPALVDLATQIATQLQVYRNAVSGTAFSVQEGTEMASIFPSIRNTQALNKAIVDSRMKAFDSSIDGAYKAVLGEKAFNAIKQGSSNSGKGSLSDGQYVEKAVKAQSLPYDQLVNNTPQGQIPVVDNKTGQIGYIPIGEFTSSTYTKL